MNWLKIIAEKMAHWVLRKARNSPDISAHEFEKWKREFKQDFGKDFK